MERQMIRALYKSCLRACNKYNSRAAELGRPAVSLLPAPIRDVLQEHQPDDGFHRLGSASLWSAVTHAFRAPSNQVKAVLCSSSPTADRVDIALKALQIVNRHMRWMCTESFSPKALEISFSLGQLIKHKKYGWTGVVVGYDATCYAGEDWKAAAKVSELAAGPDQPFYHILPSSVRWLQGNKTGEPASKSSGTVYVAQENVDLLDASCNHTSSVNVALAMLLHPALPRYFSSLHVDSLTFIPDDSMESLYNEDFLVSIWKTADSRGAGTLKLPTPKPVSGPAVHSLR